MDLAAALVEHLGDLQVKDPIYIALVLAQFRSEV